MNKAFSRPDVSSMPEQQVLTAGMNAWLDQLRAEVLRRSSQHALWRHVAEGFDEHFGYRAREKFQAGFRSLQAGLNEEVERTARAIYEELEKSPGRLATIRGSKFALDIVSIAVRSSLGTSDCKTSCWCRCRHQSRINWSNGLARLMSILSGNRAAPPAGPSRQTSRRAAGRMAGAMAGDGRYDL